MNEFQSDFVEVYDGTLESGFCRKMIKKFDKSKRLEPGRTGHGVDLTKKDSMDLTLSNLPAWQSIQAKIVDITLDYLVGYLRKYAYCLVGAVALSINDPVSGKSIAIDYKTIASLPDAQVKQLIKTVYRIGDINMQKYLCNQGGYHHWHSEVYPKDASHESLHRVLFFIYYLNTVDEGGETALFYQQKSVKPQTGRLLISPAGFTHTHKGNVPKTQDKYVLTSWLMFQRAEHLYRSNPRR